MMHVLVTGGAGFIGSHTVETLLETGVKVRVLDNFSTGKRQNLPSHPNLEIHAGDIRVPHDVHQAMEGITHVLHLAAQVSVQASIADPTHSCGINILGFMNVLNAARTQKVQRFVYASSAAVYGYPEQLPLTEQAPIKPVSPYGLEKSVNDHYSVLYQNLFAFPALGLRYFNVYGPRQDPQSPYAGVISKFLNCIQKGIPLSVYGDGCQTRDFIFVKDVAEANVRGLQSDLSGFCNVATGTSRSLLTMIEVLSRCVGRSLEIKHQAAEPGDISHSAARIDVLRRFLGMNTFTNFSDGLAQLVHESFRVKS